MLDKTKVVEILRVGRPVYKVNILYTDYEDDLRNIFRQRVGSMWVESSRKGGYLDTLECIGLIKCLITDPDEDIYMWYDVDGRVEFMFGDRKYLDILTIEELEMRIDTGNKLWVEAWNYFNEEGITW